jgi:Tol biopolymer transport system component
MPEESHLCLRSLKDVTVRSLPGTTGATLPFWSPDEGALGFFADGHLKTIDLEGGRVETLANAATGRGGTWSAGGTILFAPDLNSAILSVPSTGGSTTAVTDVTGESSHRFPFFLPDGQHFLYLALREDREQSEVRWARLGGPDGGSLGDSGSNAVYVPPGTLLLARKGALLSLPFDPVTLQITGAPSIVQEHVGVYGEEGPTGLAAFSASAAGSLAVADMPRPLLRFSWFDRKGTQRGLVGPAADYLGFDLFPDGTRAVAVRFDPRKRWSDLLTLDLRSGVTTDITDDPWPDWFGPWSPDGRRIIFTSLRHGIWRAYVEDWPRTAPEREIARCNAVDSWFPDGRSIVCEVYTREGVDLIKVSLDQRDAPATIVSGLKTPVAEARVSPDGRWLAYISYEPGRGRNLFVVRLDGGVTPPMLIAPGHIPRWRRDGRELFFLSRRTLMSVAFKSEAPTPFGTPTRLFETPLPPRDSLADNPVEFAVSGDGSQFLIPVASENEPRNAIRVLSMQR